MKEKVLNILSNVLKEAGIEPSSILVEYPEDTNNGDFSTNCAMANAKKAKLAPIKLAENIIGSIERVKPEWLEKIWIAGPGFINIKIKNKIIAEEALNTTNKIFEKENKKVLVEYTDPNIFKVFHIGHLMSNAIGESISRLTEYCGADVVRICYPSDIGLHIAKSIWAVQKHIKELPTENASIQERTDFLGRMYVEGTNAYEEDNNIKKEIDALNKKLYEKSDSELNKIYEKGKKWSLDHFDLLYKILGTTFNETIFESDMAKIGIEVVKKQKENGLFEDSEGAVVFKGEKYGLHTRVFINKIGLPTYEAKEIGLNTVKFERFPDASESIIITANEQNDYFKVLIKALSLINPKIGERSKHIGHGMMRFASGKMSSRTGNVITAESLISDIKNMVKDRIKERGYSDGEMESIADIVAISAIKFTILKSSIGSDIIFDSATSISFEGDSGPYLQYSAVRANSVIEKAKQIMADKVGINIKEIIIPEEISELERLLTRFDDIVLRAKNEYAPQHVAQYLLALAGSFNALYAKRQFVDEKDPLSPYYIKLSEAFYKIMKDGLWILGIKVPQKM